MNNQPIKIGTRDSKLAVWQANLVKENLSKIGIESTLVFIKSAADVDLKTPLHQFGGTGIFTKMLDDALEQKTIDIAVHSLKDYPTTVPSHIAIAAILERADAHDVLVYNGNTPKLEIGNHTIATGSIRRQAQWKYRYKTHSLTGLRGNVLTRLQKLENSIWTGAIFAKAGLERINALPETHLVLNWMIPAPAQGIIAVTCLASNQNLIKSLSKLNHKPTAVCAKVERDFLNKAEGGCSAPIGAHARISEGKLHFTAAIFEPNGESKVEIKDSILTQNANDFGKHLAEKVLDAGGAEIMKKIRDAG